MSKKHVAVIGATGQVGTPLTRGLLKEGHQVTAIVRGRSQDNAPKLADHETLGAKVVVCPNMQNVDSVAYALTGCDTLVASVPATKTVILESEPVWLKAAVKAGLERFVPNEFGCHTRALEMGDGEIFDRKKRFHELLFDSGIGWTLFYNGGIFDYFLPNLRFFRKITTFGNLDLPIYTHDIEDIGYIAARSITDDRTLNKCVQVDYNALTQHDMLAMLKKYWPDYPFEYEHFSSEYIIEMKENAGDDISAKKGAETDKERWGINYVIYVIGKLAGFTEETLRATELFPEYVCKRPEAPLSDPKFVFEE
ncbi:Isoflavone reductase homolog P3 (EC [Olavius algarvensis associated proteobacterium Delta 3]|nr:Isoflavone reductase homolog P3 (EC [Olavius algarvensis associated proteobacterium Delta 3]CAB5164056.1 Isoflavone reductase homolog P3 (EC [Olavius algarvensis associated proteobacterium Delta 3]